MDQLQKSKVIAIGKRGGKIIGYKGGEPIYLKEDEIEAKKKPEIKELFQPKGKSGAFNVQKLADHHADIKDLQHSTLMDTDIVSTSGGLAVYAKPADNLEAVQLKIGSSVLDVAGVGQANTQYVDFTESLVEYDKKKIGLITHFSMFPDTISEFSSLNLTAPSHSNIYKHTKMALLITEQLSEYSSYGTGKEKVLQPLARACFDSLLLHAVGAEDITAINLSFKLKDDDQSKMIEIIQNGQALQSDKAIQPSYIKSEDSNSPVLSAVYSVIGSSEELCRDFGAKVVELIGQMKSNPMTGMESKEIALRGMFGSLSTTLGRKMGTSTYSDKVNTALQSVLEVEESLIAFAKDVLKQRLSIDEIEKMFNGDVSMPIAEDDKPEPKPIPTTEAEVKEIIQEADSQPSPPQQALNGVAINFNFENKKIEKVSTLQGSSQGGVIVSFEGGEKVVLKKTKELATEQSASITLNTLLGDSLGYESSVACYHVESKDAKKKIPTEHQWIFNGNQVVGSGYIENKGTVPKKGAQMEAKLTKDQKAQLVALGIASWCVSDSDAHGGNFIIDRNDQLRRVDMGQSGIYSHLDQDPQNFHFSPNPNPIALFELLTYYAGEKTDEAPAMDIDFNHPTILKALDSIEAMGKSKGSSGGIAGLAKSRAKQARQHFETMITSAMQRRSGDSTYQFKFGQDTPLPAWSETSLGGGKKKPNQPYHFKKNFSTYKVLTSAGSGVNQAQIVRSHADGAKYVLKTFTGGKKMSGLAEATASNIAHQLLPPTVSDSGQLYYQAVPAFVVNDGSDTMSVIQQKQFNKGNLQSSNITALPTKNKQQILATSLVRFLVGDHDGHGGQYMYSSPMNADAQPDIIAVDFGNAWKHSAVEERDFLNGYMNFSPQSPPPKADRVLYQGIMSGSENLVELLDNPQIKSIIEAVEANGESYIEMATDYFDLVATKSKSKADAGKATFAYKVKNIRKEWESWVSYLIQQSGTKATYSVESGFTLAKSLVFRATENNNVYKGIRTVDEEALMDSEGTLTELALNVCSKFANLCIINFKDRVVSRDTIADNNDLSILYLQFPDLSDEFDTILNDVESRQLWL